MDALKASIFILTNDFSERHPRYSGCRQLLDQDSNLEVNSEAIISKAHRIFRVPPAPRPGLEPGG
jgi:hypothetical protein